MPRGRLCKVRRPEVRPSRPRGLFPLHLTPLRDLKHSLEGQKDASNPLFPN